VEGKSEDGRNTKKTEEIDEDTNTTNSTQLFIYNVMLISTMKGRMQDGIRQKGFGSLSIKWHIH
jgi:hypothetical protein